MWPFRKKPEPPPKDGMGFDLVPNPDGNGMRTSEESLAAFKEWASANPPPDDGYAYTASPLNPYWQRCGIADPSKIKDTVETSVCLGHDRIFAPVLSQVHYTKSYD